MKNLVYCCYNSEVVIGEIVHENPEGECTVLTYWGKYVNTFNRDIFKELTETVYNNLNDRHKKIVDNWDRDKLVECAEYFDKEQEHQLGTIQTCYV